MVCRLDASFKSPKCSKRRPPVADFSMSWRSTYKWSMRSVLKVLARRTTPCTS